jgi:pilus assembly protein CpaF
LTSAPELSSDLFTQVREVLLAQGAAPEPDSVVSALRGRDALLTPHEVNSLTSRLSDEMTGFGPLEPLFIQRGLTDVLVNAPDSVFFDVGLGLTRASICFESEAHVRALAQRLANQLNKRLDDGHPFFEARTPAGWRLHVVTPPISGEFTRISVRTPSERFWSIDSLLQARACTRAQADELAEIIAERRSFLVSGATGAGKTTVLAALLSAVAPEERVVVIEDTPELRPSHPHVVYLHARSPNVEGAGGVGMPELVRQALRMRPDRVVVGEVRGLEVVELLNALNTGHQGGGATVHANSAADSLARVHLLGLLAGLPSQAIWEQIRIGFDFVIHVEREPKLGRRIAEITPVSSLLSAGVLSR